MNFKYLSDRLVYLRSQAGFRYAPLKTLFRLVAWRILSLSGKPVTVSLPAHGGICLRVPPDWRGVSKLIYVFRDAYEPELGLLDRFLTPGSVMVDVGANYGIYSLVASRLVGDAGRVFAFEPAGETYAALEENIRLNGCGNIEAYPWALSDRQGKARLYHDPDPGKNSLADHGNGLDFEEVSMTTLDTTLARAGVKMISFLKIDTEGADELVCRGAADILQRDRPAILFEINAPAANRLDLPADGAWNFLAQMGYRFYALEDMQEVLRELSESPPGGNILALASRSSQHRP